MSRSLLMQFILLFGVFLPVVFGQTVTVPDPNVPGGSIVEIITVDPIQGIPTTEIVQSIPPADDNPDDPNVQPTPAPVAVQPAANPAKPTTPPPPQVPNPGPVGAPPTTTIPVGEGTTQYDYTTIIDGETTVLHDTFTPTYNTPTPPPSPTSGTIMQFTDWASLIGTNTQAPPTSGDKHIYHLDITFFCSAVFAVFFGVVVAF